MRGLQPGLLRVLPELDASAARLLPGGERVESFLARRTKKDRARVERALDGIRRYGAPALLLSWVPIVGDPLVAAAGLARVGWLPFLVFVAVGKAARYAVVAAGAAAVATVLT